MDYRTIQLTGGATYIISLPSKWIKKHGLGKGMKVGIFETQQGDLIIKIRESRLSEITLNLTSHKDLEFLKREIITKYLQGYDQIKISSERYMPTEVRTELKNLKQSLIGFESFGESSNELTFRILLQKDIDVFQTTKQMCYMSLSSLQELINAIKTSNKEILVDILQREEGIDKFYFLILRQISLNYLLNTGWVQIAKSIERLSDHIENIAKLSGLILNEKNFSAEKDIKLQISMYSGLPAIYLEVIQSLEDRDALKANEIITKIEKLRSDDEKELKRLMKKITLPQVILIHESFRRIREYISDIAEVIINMR